MPKCPRGLRAIVFFVTNRNVQVNNSWTSSCMLYASAAHHARIELHNAMSLMINIRLLSNPLHSLSIIAIPILLSQNAAAFPLISMTPRDSKSSLGRRNTNSSSGGVSPQVWVRLLTLPLSLFLICSSRCSQVPILAIAFVLALAAVWTCAKRGWWKHLSMFSWGTTPSDASPAQETRELTAEQLAGSINANATSTTTTRARRNRRPRRTPSQISTTSLPAYNKEPGEQELVIFR